MVYNTSIGYQSLYASLITGSYNTAFGYLAGYNNTSSSYVTIVDGTGVAGTLTNFVAINSALTNPSFF